MESHVRDMVLQAIEDIDDERLLVTVILLLRDPRMARRFAQFIDAPPALRAVLEAPRATGVLHDAANDNGPAVRPPETP